MILREIKTAFSSEVPIIDNEISNDISAPPGQSWHYENADIISCAIFYGNRITILFREHNDDIDIYKLKLKEMLDKLPTCFAFNYSMEKGNFVGFLGKRYFIEEIKPFKGKGKTKEWFFNELFADGKVQKKFIPEDTISDKSDEVLELYKKKDYETIINHNATDVIKQYFIWKYKSYILEKYKNKIDKNGWFVENGIS